MFNNTDNELQRYEEAELYSATATPDMFSDIKSQFNTVTGQTDLLAPLPSGGFVRLASQAPEIMVEAPAMPGQGADAALPVEGPIARAAEQTALETEPATAEMRPSLAGRTEVVKEVTKGLINGAIVQPANFLKENFGLYDPLAVQFVDPQTGEFDFKLHIMSREEKADLDAKMAAGELPYAMSLDDLVAPDKDASAVAGAAGGISQFLGAYLGIGKLFRVGSGFTGGMTQGAAADFLAFDGSDKAVTDLLLDMGWIEPNMITELLKKDPTDPDYVGRFQAAVEGAGFGAFIEKAMIPVLGLAFRAIKDKDVPVDAARQAIQQGKLMMQGALLKAGQNAELRIKERGTGTTLNMGGDPMALTDPLVAAAGRAVGGDLSKQVDDARIAYEASPNDAALRKNYFELRRQRDADPVAKVEPPTDDTPGIIAFHGSAADFSEFKLEKIGTGEGAQAYGYGLYFADKEDIAKFYRDSLVDPDSPRVNLVDGEGQTVSVLDAPDGITSLFNDMTDTDVDYTTLIARANERLNWAKTRKSKEISKAETAKAQEALTYLQENQGLNFKKEGRIYKVGLTPKPDDLLDYDKPFNEQTPAIQAALKKAGYKTERNMVVKEDGDNRFGVYETNDDGTETLLKHFTEPMLFKGPLEKQAQDFIVEQNAELLNNTGGQILDVLASGIAQKGLHLPGGRKKDAERLASDALFKAGIPGIKYLDNTSRDGAGTSSNYVIFDDSMIKILEKYGIVGPVAISAMALSEDDS